MVIKVENLVKRYGELVVLDHFNLEVGEGEIFGLLGPNGSGKSTSIHCMLSLLTYDKGEVMLFDKKMTPKSYDIKKDIGIVMQNVAVFEELTVYENIDYFCSLYVKDKERRKELVESAIDFCALNSFVKFYPAKLSGGLLRRLNIACGIVHKPKLVIMDEPTVAVDPQSRNNILEGIKKLNKEGTTILYTSHYMEEIEQICTRIAIMDRGRIIAKGTKEELKAMIGLGEKITMEVYQLEREKLEELKKLPGVKMASYDGNILTVKSEKGRNNLSPILHYMEEGNVVFGKVYTEMPTLNDVFLEMTGKELRDNG